MLIVNCSICRIVYCELQNADLCIAEFVEFAELWIVNCSICKIVYCELQNLWNVDLCIAEFAELIVVYAELWIMNCRICMFGKPIVLCIADLVNITSVLQNW